MTASIESPSNRGQFLDRFLAFFAGAAIAVWFLGGLSSSTTESASLAGPETQVVSALTSESTTILTRMSEELIVQVASTFQESPETAPFATIGEDGQVRVLSIEAFSEDAFIAPGDADQSESSRILTTGQLAARQSQPKVELVSGSQRPMPRPEHALAAGAGARPAFQDCGSQKSLAAELNKGQQRDGPKRSHPLLA